MMSASKMDGMKVGKGQITLYGGDGSARTRRYLPRWGKSYVLAAARKLAREYRHDYTHKSLDIHINVMVAGVVSEEIGNVWHTTV